MQGRNILWLILIINGKWKHNSISVCKFGTHTLVWLRDLPIQREWFWHFDSTWTVTRYFRQKSLFSLHRKSLKSCFSQPNTFPVDGIMKKKLWSDGVESSAHPFSLLLSHNTSWLNCFWCGERIWEKAATVSCCLYPKRALCVNLHSPHFHNAMWMRMNGKSAKVNFFTLFSVKKPFTSKASHSCSKTWFGKYISEGRSALARIIRHSIR